MPLSSREIIRLLEAAGWRLDRQAGDHLQFRHPSRPGVTTVPHPKKDLDRRVLRSIERQSGVDLDPKRRRR